MNLAPFLNQLRLQVLQMNNCNNHQQEGKEMSLMGAVIGFAPPLIALSEALLTLEIIIAAEAAMVLMMIGMRITLQLLCVVFGEVAAQMIRTIITVVVIVRTAVPFNVASLQTVVVLLPQPAVI